MTKAVKLKTVTFKKTPPSICCPPPDAPLWCLHPRVYLPLAKTKREACPYCGTVYLVEGNAG